MGQLLCGGEKQSVSESFDLEQVRLMMLTNWPSEIKISVMKHNGMHHLSLMKCSQEMMLKCLALATFFLFAIVNGRPTEAEASAETPTTTESGVSFPVVILTMIPPLAGLTSKQIICIA
ncbi:unnamed protein product [Toxocara canis]|uniref:Transmembrane protein n=1 Tax=Toxocara canis TaxID=6265 RepID=A0A183VDE5_TOXCA|nr:unnamed protein product [Toxocara canis]